MVHPAGEKGNVYVVTTLSELGSDFKENYFVVIKQTTKTLKPLQNKQNIIQQKNVTEWALNIGNPCSHLSSNGITLDKSLFFSESQDS